MAINFPTSVDIFTPFRDPDLASLSLIQQYNTYIAQGNLSAANAILDTNPSLKSMQLNAENMNQFLEALTAIERFFLEQVQAYLVNVVKYQGDWNSNKKYVKYDVVNYVVDGATQSYMGILTDIPIGTLPTNTTYFVCLTMRGAQGASGTGLSPRGVWASTIQYHKDDCISYDNALWQSLGDNINANPNNSPTLWIKIMDLSRQIIFSDNEPMSTQQGVDDIWIKDLGNNKYEIYKKNVNSTYTPVNLNANMVLMSNGTTVETAVNGKANGDSGGNAIKALDTEKVCGLPFSKFDIGGSKTWFFGFNGGEDTVSPVHTNNIIVGKATNADTLNNIVTVDKWTHSSEPNIKGANLCLTSDYVDKKMVIQNYCDGVQQYFQIMQLNSGNGFYLNFGHAKLGASAMIHSTGTITISQAAPTQPLGEGCIHHVY